MPSLDVGSGLIGDRVHTVMAAAPLQEKTCLADPAPSKDDGQPSVGGRHQPVEPFDLGLSIEEPQYAV
jgi:hypothetical protein